MSAFLNRTQHLLQGAGDLRQALTFAAGAAFAVESVRFFGVSAHRLGGHRRTCRLDVITPAAIRFRSGVLEEQGVYGALEPNVQLADFALGKRDDRHTYKAEMLEQRGDIRLITTDAI